MCRWIINFEDANSTAFIRAHFIGLVTKEDFVRVYAGINDTSRVIVDSSVNPSADRTVVSTIQITEMLVVFVTDNQTGNDGVGFDIKIMESLDLSGSGCFQNEILEAKDTVQYLTSPNFPDLYKKNSNCAWTLVASPISEVTVYIVFVNLDFVGSTCYHYLRIVGFGDFCKTYDSESTRETYNYSASIIQVKFHSDNVIAKIGSGFVIKYVKNNKPTENTTPQETTTTAVHTPIEVTEMLTRPYISTREYFIANVTTNKTTTEKQSELIITTEYMTERTTKPEITTKQITITDEIVTEQMNTAEISTELTTTALIKNPETTVITTKETTNGPITNEKLTTQTLVSTDNTTSEPNTTEFTTDQTITAIITVTEQMTSAEISTELTTTAEIKNAGESTAISTEDTINGLKTNDKLGTPIMVSTDNTTTEQKTTEFTFDQTKIATKTITELMTSAEISTELTTTAEIKNTELTRTVSDASLVGIVIGGLVTMTIFGIIVGITFYAFVLKRYYSSESYDKILHRSSSLSQNVPTVSPKNIIPRWISMWDAFKMPGYNPTFQPLHEISPKVGTMPKWVKMMDSFEKSVHLQKVWKNYLEYVDK